MILAVILSRYITIDILSSCHIHQMEAFRKDSNFQNSNNMDKAKHNITYLIIYLPIYHILEMLRSSVSTFKTTEIS